MAEKLCINEKCWYKDFCTRPEQEIGCSGCIKFLEMNYLMEHSGLPKAKQKPIKLKPTTDNDFEMFDKLDEIRRNIYNFVVRGDNLYIASKYVGNGKTSWAIKLLHKYFEEIWEGNCLRTRGLFVHVPTLLSELKDFNNPISPEYRQLLRNCDLIVWDDIACDMLSNYDITQLTILIDGRMLAEKSNIYTGNITDMDKMTQILGMRLASRVFNASELIILDGKDER